METPNAAFEPCGAPADDIADGSNARRREALGPRVQAARTAPAPRPERSDSIRRSATPVLARPLSGAAPARAGIPCSALDHPHKHRSVRQRQAIDGKPRRVDLRLRPRMRHQRCRSAPRPPPRCATHARCPHAGRRAPSAERVAGSAPCTIAMHSAPASKSFARRRRAMSSQASGVREAGAASTSRYATSPLGDHVGRIGQHPHYLHVVRGPRSCGRRWCRADRRAGCCPRVAEQRGLVRAVGPAPPLASVTSSCSASEMWISSTAAAKRMRPLAAVAERARGRQHQRRPPALGAVQDELDHLADQRHVVVHVRADDRIDPLHVVLEPGGGGGGVLEHVRGAVRWPQTAAGRGSPASL
jgi:hypothetical protein